MQFCVRVAAKSMRAHFGMRRPGGGQKSSKQLNSAIILPLG